MKSGIQLIAEERERQIACGYDAEHDDAVTPGTIAIAAAAYALPEASRQKFGAVPSIWKWAKLKWKPSPDDRIKELQKAGALIAAEIDRLQRQAL